MKLLPHVVACLILLGCSTSCAKAPPKLVDFDRLLEKPEHFKGKIVRVRGFLFVSLGDVPVIALCARENEARGFTTSRRCMLTSPSNAQLSRVNMKSAWVEIVGRFGVNTAGNRKRMLGLSEIQTLEKMPEANTTP